MFASRPVSFALTVIAFAAALLWPALVNGGPFWFPDTSTYIRGADAAYVAATGDTTEWSGEIDKVVITQPSDRTAPVIAGKAPPSAQVKPVLSGRSIYYGASLYAPMQLIGSWGAVIVQALLVAFAVVLALRIASRGAVGHAPGSAPTAFWRRALPYGPSRSSPG